MPLPPQNLHDNNYFLCRENWNEKNTIHDNKENDYFDDTKRIFGFS